MSQTFFPQINSNYILTQLPYESGSSYDTVVQDVESGPRFTFPRRASGLTGYPTKPLFSGSLNFPNITDAEVTVLKAFFNSMLGRYGTFAITDPNGNLFQYSEAFNHAYWGSGPAQGQADPYGHALATSSAALTGIIFPIGEGPTNPMVLNLSLYCYATASAQSITLTLVSSGGTFSRTFSLPPNRWSRVDFNALASGSGVDVTGGFSSFTGNMFGAQCSPLKGCGGYVYSNGPNSEGYGYRRYCRFDVDSFDLAMLGPNQNAVKLPVVEKNT